MRHFLISMSVFVLLAGNALVFATGGHAPLPPPVRAPPPGNYHTAGGLLLGIGLGVSIIGIVLSFWGTALPLAVILGFWLGAALFFGVNMAAWYHGIHALRWNDTDTFAGIKDNRRAKTGLLLSVIAAIITGVIGTVIFALPTLFVPRRPKHATR